MITVRHGYLDWDAHVKRARDEVGVRRRHQHRRKCRGTSKLAVRESRSWGTARVTVALDATRPAP